MKRKSSERGTPSMGTPLGFINVPGVGPVRVINTVMKAYYYGVAMPQDIDAGATIGLFCDHIGDSEWTNLTRERMLPVGHTALIYKVSLAVRATAEARIVDVYNALQHGGLTIRIGSSDFVREPLCFFPVNIYGEIAAREDDPLQRLALAKEMPVGSEDAGPLMKAISGIAIPAMIGESQTIDGDLDLKKELYRTPAFVLYVVLHTVTQTPVH